MKIQYISDIHLELHKGKILDIPILAKYLALAGDVGQPQNDNYTTFLQRCSNDFEKVFLIAGNHEYYMTKNNRETMEERKNKIRQVVLQFPNIHFLDNNFVDADNVRILGTTLWSYIPNKHSYDVLRSINDYRQIKFGDRMLEIGDVNQMHKEAVVWLHKEINVCKEIGKKVVVISHHAPLKKGTSPPEYERSDRFLNSAFASDLSTLVRPPVAAWIFGHTHHRCDFIHQGTRVVTFGTGYDWKPALDKPVVEL